MRVSQSVCVTGPSDFGIARVWLGPTLCDGKASQADHTSFGARVAGWGELILHSMCEIDNSTKENKWRSEWRLTMEIVWIELFHV